MTRVYAFGTFDGIHPGHHSFLRQAKSLGDHLTVIVARDTNVRRHKGEPALSENERRDLVEALTVADAVQLGELGESYEILRRAPIDILCLGYDQWRDEDVRKLLEQLGRTEVKVIRAKPLLPWLFRGRLLRGLGLVRTRLKPGNVDKPS